MILRFLRSAFGQDLFRDFDDTLHSALPDFPEGLVICLQLPGMCTAYGKEVGRSGAVFMWKSRRNVQMLVKLT